MIKIQKINLKKIKQKIIKKKPSKIKLNIYLFLFCITTNIFNVFK